MEIISGGVSSDRKRKDTGMEPWSNQVLVSQEVGDKPGKWAVLETSEKRYRKGKMPVSNNEQEWRLRMDHGF